MLTTKTNEQKRAYSVANIAKEFKTQPAVIRRILRAAAIKKPNGGWNWPDKAAAKDALAAVSRAQAPKKK